MFANKKKIYKFAVIIAVSFLTGLLIQRFIFSSINHDKTKDNSEKHENTIKDEIWTCSMHPSIRLPKPGKCPICNMDLILLNTDNSGNSDVQLSISSNAFKLLEIETTPVVRKFVDSEVRMLGKVEYDETRLSYISAWVPGRLEKLFINYTGIAVKQGERMATIYSPDLISAQEELIQALKFKDNIQNSTYGTAQKTAIDTVKASREKLSLLGLSSEQITKIETTRASNKIIDINSPIQGIVIEKTAEEGMYVKTGTRIYTVADLSFVWVKLDAYESDLALIKYGDIVEFSTETYPGKTFEGQVDFIDPVVTQSSQTIKVRVSVPNESLELKPGMFVNAIVKSQIDGSSTLAPLIIPVTAAMKTGTRAIVYVEVQKKKPTYEGREITLGPKVGNFYIVKGGLKEGERVVTRGNFKLDAEMQIRAKPSMMSEDKDTMTDMQNEQHEEISNKTEQSEQMDAIPEKFSSQLNKVLQSYFAIQKAMVNDDSKDVSKATQLAVESLKSVDMTLLDHKTHMLWMKNADALSMTLQMLSKQSTLVKQRELLPRLTDEMLQVVQQFSVGQANIYKASCPMAFDNKGASWLQDSDKIQNPYFGNVMQTCGSIDEVIQENISGESE